MEDVPMGGLSVGNLQYLGSQVIGAVQRKQALEAAQADPLRRAQTLKVLMDVKRMSEEPTEKEKAAMRIAESMRSAPSVRTTNVNISGETVGGVPPGGVSQDVEFLAGWNELTQKYDRFLGYGKVGDPTIRYKAQVETWRERDDEVWARALADAEQQIGKEDSLIIDAQGNPHFNFANPSEGVRMVQALYDRRLQEERLRYSRNELNGIPPREIYVGLHENLTEGEWKELLGIKKTEKPIEGEKPAEGEEPVARKPVEPPVEAEVPALPVPEPTPTLDQRVVNTLQEIQDAEWNMQAAGDIEKLPPGIKFAPDISGLGPRERERMARGRMVAAKSRFETLKDNWLAAKIRQYQGAGVPVEFNVIWEVPFPGDGVMYFILYTDDKGVDRSLFEVALPGDLSEEAARNTLLAKMKELGVERKR